MHYVLQLAQNFFLRIVPSLLFSLVAPSKRFSQRITSLVLKEFGGEDEVDQRYFLWGRMESDMEADGNPMFGQGVFKPSLQVINEDVEREQSSYYHEAEDAKHLESKHSSSSGMASTPVGSVTKTILEKDVPQDSPKEISPAEKRLSRLSSLSRLIRTKSGRVLKTDLEREEKDNDDDYADDRRATLKKRASLLAMFKTT